MVCFFVFVLCFLFRCVVLRFCFFCSALLVLWLDDSIYRLFFPRCWVGCLDVFVA